MKCVINKETILKLYIYIVRCSFTDVRVRRNLTAIMLYVKEWRRYLKQSSRQACEILSHHQEDYFSILFSFSLLAWQKKARNWWRQERISIAYNWTTTHPHMRAIQFKALALERQGKVQKETCLLLRIPKTDTCESSAHTTFFLHHCLTVGHSYSAINSPEFGHMRRCQFPALAKRKRL